MDRAQAHKLFIRVCRDSGFQIDAGRAARLVGGILGEHPLSVWAAFPSFGDMSRIARGEHPCLSLPAYTPTSQETDHG